MRLSLDESTSIISCERKCLVCTRTSCRSFLFSEHANFSVSLVSGSGSGEVLGLLSLVDYPPPQCSMVEQAASWEEWIHSNYQCPKVSVSRASRIRLGHTGTVSCPSFFSTCPAWIFSDRHRVVTPKCSIISRGHDYTGKAFALILEQLLSKSTAVCTLNRPRTIQFVFINNYL